MKVVGEITPHSLVVRQAGGQIQLRQIHVSLLAFAKTIRPMRLPRAIPETEGRTIVAQFHELFERFEFFAERVAMRELVVAGARSLSRVPDLITRRLQDFWIHRHTFTNRPAEVHALLQTPVPLPGGDGEPARRAGRG